MKKLFCLATGLSLGIVPLYAQQKLEDTPKASKILIAYYSRSGNTKAMALQIKEETKGTTFEIEPKNPYPKEYRETTEQAKKEINDGYKPPLKENLKSIKEYDVIFIGTPNWWSTMAPPVATFLSSHDFTGKTVIPFITHEGSGLGRYMEDLRKLVPKAKVMDGKAIRGGRVKDSKEEVISWLRGIKAVETPVGKEKEKK